MNTQPTRQRIARMAAMVASQLPEDDKEALQVLEQARRFVISNDQVLCSHESCVRRVIRFCGTSPEAATTG